MAKRVPGFTYGGSYSTGADDTYWYIYLKSSGTLNLKNTKQVDVFLVGGGGGGGSSGGSGSSTRGGGGGGGGYTKTQKGITAKGGTNYTAVVGSGGAGGGYTGATSGVNGKAGGSTSIFGYSVSGGNPGIHEVYNGYPYPNTSTGGAGGSGGSAGRQHDPRLAGGSNGSDGSVGYGDDGAYIGNKGKGQGSTTREFGLASGKLYATGGAGGCTNTALTGTAGAANTGDGGGGGDGGKSGGAGGCGIIVIRGTQEDTIPVSFNGTTLEKIMFNGVEVKSLIVNGVKLFMERMKRRMQVWNTSTRAGSPSSRPI